MKMVNFAALDETFEQRSISNMNAADREIWSGFFAAPETFLDRVDGRRQVQFNLPSSSEILELREGRDVEYTAKGRWNQDFFRRSVLAAYNNRCAVTGKTQTELLVASQNSALGRRRRNPRSADERDLPQCLA
jgi:putative restriction endonuclease